MNSFQKYRREVAALAAYVILAILLTYPLVLHFTTHVAGDGRDDPALAWNLWWVPHAIINLGTSPIYTEYMFYPIGLNLAFYTLTYLNAFLSIPLQYAFNLVVAANANLWFSFIAGGFGAYLLVKWILGRSKFNVQGTPADLAAFIAGAVYAFSSNKLLYASLGQFNIASSHWIPFYVLFLLKLLNGRSANGEARNTKHELQIAFLLGLFLLFQALSEFIYASFLIIFTGLYLIFWLFMSRPKRTNLYRSFLALLVSAITFVIPMLPILIAMFQDMATEGDFIQQGLGFADVFSSDLLGFFVPSQLHPLFGGLVTQFHFAYTNFAYLGFVALGLALIAMWQVPQARLWGILGGLFALISLGPSLSINGAQFSLPLPFNLLLEIPLVKGNRYPSRWSVMVTLALAVLVGYGIFWISQKSKIKSQKLASVLPFAFLLFTLFEYLSIPLPLSDFKIPDVYQTIARDQGDFTVLEIPLAWRNGFRMTGTLDSEMMFEQWYQTEHQHPILSGNTSRNPELKFQYFTEAPVINSIIAVETGHALDASIWEHDKQLAPQVLDLLKVRYVIWHSPRDPQNQAALNAAREYIEKVLPITKFSDAIDETGETVAYRVNAESSPNQAHILPNSQGRLNFSEGWGALDNGTPVWATRRDARLFLNLGHQGDVKLIFAASAPMPNQIISIIFNGQSIGGLTLQLKEAEYSIDVPQQATRVGMNEVTFHFDQLMPAASVDGEDNQREIGITKTISPVSIVARSAGSEVGDFAHVFVNGVDAARNARGYNIVVVNEKTGAVEASAAFDTFASAQESTRLAQFIASIPNGRIVAAVVRDEASRYLTEEAVRALQSIGAQEDLRGKWRWSHAVIGVKGATTGVLETANEIAPAQLVVGTGAMEPNVAAAFAWIKIEPR